MFDGTASSTRQIYVDGVFQGQRTTIPWTVKFANLSHLVLGSTQGTSTNDTSVPPVNYQVPDAPIGGTGGFYTGKMYDVRMYNYPLNAIQVTNIYSPAAQAASKEMFTFTFPTYGAATIAGTNISITVPFATDVTALAPTYTISGVSATPASGSPQNFTTPQTYTVTAQDSSTKAYLVTVNIAPISSSKDILTFGPGAVITGTDITWVVPYGPALTNLAPTYTLSSLVATGAPPSGTARDFATPQTYTVTAQDGSTKAYTVVVAVLGPPFTWANAVSGNWSDPAKWTNSLGAAEAPATTGQSDYVLNFPRTGTYTPTHDLADGFLVNQLNFGGAVTIGGASGLALTANGALLPRINQNSASAVTLVTPINLAGNLTVGGTAFGAVTLSGAISGTGSLTKTSLGGLTLSGVNSTYEGGTLVNAGALSLGGTANDLFGTGAVRVNSPATLNLNGNGNLMNAFTFNGVTVNNGNSFSANLNGPVTLEATTTFDLFTTGNMTIGGDVSGPGGLTKNGIGQGPLVLNGVNTYAGPTTVNAGTLIVKSLYGNDESKWTPANITVASGAALVVNVGGPGEFTGDQAGTFFANLSTVNNNGLKAGASIGFGTGNAGATVQTVSAILANSTGPGGGAVGLKKYGTGTLELTGANTYSGPTSIDNNGTLQVSSFNSVSSPAASSSLGRPTTVDNGTIQIGKYSFSGGGLIYTGAGETTDRVINMAGANGSTYRLDQSGSGLLKFTSAFTAGPDLRGPKTINLQGGTDGTGEIAGAIPVMNSAVGSETRLTKSGTGTWTLSANNLYTGVTTVSGGTLLVKGSTDAASAVTVQSGGTLGGTGTINGTVTVNAGGTTLLGASGATLTLANVTAPSYASTCTLKILASASTLDKISAPNATTGNSVANVALLIDTTGLSVNVPSTTIYSAPGVNSTAFASVTVIGNTAYTAILDYSTPGQIKLALSLPSPSTARINPPNMLTGDVTIDFDTVVGFCYKVQYTDVLPVPPGTWIDLGATVQATGITMSVTDPGAALTYPQRFYRVVQVLVPCP